MKLKSDIQLDIQIEYENPYILSYDDFYKILEKIPIDGQWGLCIRIVSNNEIQELNKTYRHKNKPTNILSFPYEVEHEFNPENYLGDLIIAADIVEQEAMEQHKKIYDHWAHLVVHGVLHLLGFDHENDHDAKIMEGKEVEILALLNINNPYKK